MSQSVCRWRSCSFLTNAPSLGASESLSDLVKIPGIGEPISDLLNFFRLGPVKKRTNFIDRSTLFVRLNYHKTRASEPLRDIRSLTHGLETDAVQVIPEEPAKVKAHVQACERVLDEDVVDLHSRQHLREGRAVAGVL